MKGDFIKKSISFFLILIMLLSSFSTIAYAATLDTNTSNENNSINTENKKVVDSDSIIKDNVDEKNTIISNDEEEKKEENNDENSQIINDNEIKENQKTYTVTNDNFNQNELNTLNEEKIIQKKSEQTIKDGIYKVQLYENLNKVLDISGASYNSGANVQIWDWSKVAQQEYIFTYTDDGYYIIKNLRSNKVLDVQNGSMLSGANVWQYDENDSDAQKWEIKSAGCGYYYIVSKLSGKYLDVSGGLQNNGTNIQVWNCNGSNAQKFKLTEIENLVGTNVLENGRYKIGTVLDKNKVLDISGGSLEKGANVQIWDWSKVAQQEFDITYLNNGCYIIQNVKSKKALDVQYGSIYTGTNVWQYDQNNSVAQQWIIKESSTNPGYYNIVSSINGLYLDVSGSNSANGTNIQLWDKTDSNAQEFEFTKVDRISGEQSIPDGLYKISTMVNPDKVLDISGGSYNLGANVQLWEWANVDQQKFEVKYNGNGLYTIKSFKSQKALDVQNGSMLSGTNIWQYDSNNSEAQEWVIKQDLENPEYYSVISYLNECCLDVSGGVANNGTNIQVWENNGSNAQKFKFTPTNKLTCAPIVTTGQYRICTALDSGKVLDVAGASFDNNANVQLWNWSAVKQQKYNIVYHDDGGYYTITCDLTGKALEVSNNNMKSGANVCQNDYNNSDAQKWILIKDTENIGCYYIQSVMSEKYLDVCGGVANNGTNVQVYEGNKSTAQRFRFDWAPKNGVDVSAWNGTINWAQLKPHIDFAMLRVGFRGYGDAGNFAIDTQYDNNIKGVMDNGIPFGIYFFSQAKNRNEGVDEANKALEWLKNYPIQYPIVIDSENSSVYPNGRADNLTQQERTWAIQGFCDRIKEAGYKPMIYASKDWLRNNLFLDQLQGVDIWLAHYLNNAPNVTSDYNGSYQMWQYASDGSLPGVNGRLDMNILYKQY